MKKCKARSSSAALIFFILFSCISFSQISPDIYKRADSLIKMSSGRVYYGNVQPEWIGNTNSFLYENLTPSGTEYIIADAVKLTKRRAFNQEKFAASLKKTTGKSFDAGKLPIDNIVFSDKFGSFAFTYDKYNWICRLRDYSIIRRDPVSQRQRSDRWDWGFRDELTDDTTESPDKKWLAYIKNYNVYIESAEDRKEYQLSYDGGLGEYYSSFIKWSPDSKKLEAYRVKPAEKHIIHYIESSPVEQLQPKHYSYEYQKPGDAVPQRYPQLFDIESRKHLSVDDGSISNQYSVNNIKWSRDNRYFTYEYNQRGHQLYQVVRVDANSGRSMVVINEESPTFIDYSGKRYRFDAEDTDEIIWASERDGWNHLYLCDSGTGKVKNQITTGEWVVREVVNVDEKNRQITFKASGKEDGDPYFIYYYRINFDGTGLILLTEGEGNHDAYFSPDNKFIVDTWSTVEKPPVAVLRNADDGSELMVLEKADISKLLETGLQLPEVFVSKGRDGVTDIWGIIIRPTNFDPSKNYPVIEDIYAGPHSSFVPKSFRPSATNMHQLAELGFIVVKIDGMGTSNRSKAFHDVCWKNLKDAGFPDRILWIKAAAQKYPYMDLQRVGIYGTSAGGQSAAGAVLFYPDFYKAAVSSCGCHDNRMDKMWWNEQWMGWPVGEEYALSSNVDNAWRLKGKLLLINGEMDNNVDPSSTAQVVNALIKAKKDFEYLLLPGAKHTNGGTYGERKRRDFFVKHLLGAEPPDWNIIEK
jgi:dipeptidyl aminopeptidase/acylaminoacyl peptidase